MVTVSVMVKIRVWVSVRITVSDCRIQIGGESYKMQINHVITN